MVVLLCLLVLVVVVGVILFYVRYMKTPAKKVFADGDVSNAANLADLQKAYGFKLTQVQGDYLAANKFILIPVDGTNFSKMRDSNDDMLGYFDGIGGSYNASERTDVNAKLVTPDIVLHAYHKFFDLSLEQIEQTSLAPLLDKFLAGLAENASSKAQTAPDDLGIRYQNLAAQLTVARVLLENKAAPAPAYFSTPGDEAVYVTNDATADSFENAKALLAKYDGGLSSDLSAAAERELRLIYDHQAAVVSPLFAQYAPSTSPEDYTQYTPRSHYAKNSQLRAYFRSMMYLGRKSYRLNDNLGIEDAALLADLYGGKDADGNRLADDWQKIMKITSYFAGPSDDITYPEFGQYVKNALGKDFSSTDLESPDTLAALKSHLSDLRTPKILSGIVIDDQIANRTKNDLLKNSLGFRVFGQRFTYDAWILNDLTAGQESTDVRLPSMPSALFIPAALGDARARSYAGDFLKQSGFSDKEVSGFMTKLDQKSEQLAKVTDADWDGSLGGSWLNLLRTLAVPVGNGYPAYMCSPKFSVKQIQTFLGSFAELKHDTLLYAKQSYAELGGAAEGEDVPPPVPKGFVEPNLAFWDKLSSLVDRSQQVFADADIKLDQAKFRLDNFKKMVEFYKTLARKEMAGTPITDDEYEELRTKSLDYMAVPYETGATPDPNAGRVALIADIHTDALSGQVLYEATAKPYLMLAYVDNENSPRLVIGPVFSHYEVAGPLGSRKTDEEWKSQVYEKNELPAKNFWYADLELK